MTHPASLSLLPDEPIEKENASDQGAFSFLPGVAPEKLRQIIKGYEFRVTSAHARRVRDMEDWSGAFVVGIHRDIFSPLFPQAAGHFRRSEILFGRRTGAQPEHIISFVEQLVVTIRSHLTEVRALGNAKERIVRAFMFAAIDHSEMLRIHPFIDGNGRWARVVTVLFLRDCGLPIGTILRKRDKAKYIAAADRCLDDGEPGDLANLFLRGYVEILKGRHHAI